MPPIHPAIVHDANRLVNACATSIFSLKSVDHTGSLEDTTMNTTTAARVAVYIGRVFFTFALLALIGAWITQLYDGRLLGMSQQHLFNDAMVLALLGIGSFLDAFWHARRV